MESLQSDSPDDLEAQDASPTFGVIAEGPSDFVVLRYCLAGYFEDPDLVTHQIQPKPGEYGGWTEVLRFLGTTEVSNALGFSDYLIVHIDTDKCDEVSFGIKRHNERGELLTPDLLRQRVIERLVSAIPAEVRDEVTKRIIFAIAVDSIECWLLPLYWTDARRSKMTNCIHSLNEKLSAQEGFSIDVDKKQVKYYQKISKCLARPRQLANCFPHNPSFSLFIQELDTRFQDTDSQPES